MTTGLAALRLDRRFVAWALAWALASLVAFVSTSLDDDGRAFIGGLLAHSRGLCAVAAPTRRGT